MLNRRNSFVFRAINCPKTPKNQLLSTQSDFAKKDVFHLKNGFFGLVLESFSPVIHNLQMWDKLSLFCELTKGGVALSLPPADGPRGVSPDRLA
tara:strand:+ start:445 stop:726 length:282 start_codon:yes stop_codon:yes gene_type:complete